MRLRADASGTSDRAFCAAVVGSVRSMNLAAATSPDPGWRDPASRQTRPTPAPGDPAQAGVASPAQAQPTKLMSERATVNRLAVDFFANK